MLRLLLTLFLLLIPGLAISCTFPIPKPFREVIQTADQIYIFRLESLAEVKDRAFDEEGWIDIYSGSVAGKIKIVRILRGKPEAKFIRFSTSMCGGIRLDVGHYFLVATSDKSIVLTPVPADQSILDFRGSYWEDGDARINDKSYILRNVLPFINGKQLPKGFPDYQTRSYTQPFTEPPP
jgi:hypothetical protein